MQLRVCKCMKFFGKIESGKLIISRANDFKLYIKNQKDCRIELEIKKQRKIRSLNQNNLYWWWLEIIGQDLGYDPEELHAAFRAKFLTDYTLKIPLPRSTAKLNKVQFGQYLDKIQRLAAELGIALPEPANCY